MSRILKLVAVVAVVAIVLMAWKAATRSTDVEVEYET